MPASAGREEPVEEACRRRAVGASRLSIVALLAILVTGSLLNAVPAAASSGIGIFVGYADSLRANPTNFPTPWFGSPNTVFYGCAPATACIYDAGGVRIVNNTGSSVTVNAVAVHVDTCTFGGWPPAVLTPGADLIVTQLSTGGTGGGCAEPSHMDTSDVGRGGVLWTRHCDASGILPTVASTINGP